MAEQTTDTAAYEDWRQACAETLDRFCEACGDVPSGAWRTLAGMESNMIGWASR